MRADEESGDQPSPQDTDAEPQSFRRRIPLWLVVAASLLLGVCLGALFMRHRANTQKVVAAVNGTIITQNDLFSRLQTAAGPAVVRKIVEEELQLQFAKKMGFSPTAAQIDAQVALDSKQPGFEQTLAVNLVSEREYRRLVQIRLAQEQVITQGIKISDAEARRYYSTQVDSHNPRSQFFRPDTVTLQVIATPSQTEVRNALKSLAEGTPFDIAAGTYSQDSSKVNGGLLDPMQRGHSPLSQSPRLEATIFSLHVGQQMAPLMYKGQWWIFRCRDKSPGGLIPYAQVVAQCQRGARLQKGLTTNGPKLQTQFAAFQRAATLQAFWPQYTQAVHGN